LQGTAAAREINSKGMVQVRQGGTAPRAPRL